MYIVPNETSVYVATLVVQLLIQDRIRAAQEKDPKFLELKERASLGEAPNFMTVDRLLRCENRVYVLNDDEL